MADNKFNTEQRPVAKKTGLSTGAKVAISTVCLVGLVGLTIFGVNKTIEWHEDKQETSRAESLVACYVNENNLCDIPEQIFVNKGFDQEYCDGAKIVNALTSNNIDYCYIDGTYYTEDGKDIAILTFNVSQTITAEVIKEEVNGTVVYMAPAGYTLNPDGTCTKVVTTEHQEIVPASTNGDYSQYGEDVEVTVVQTRPYTEIADQSLICDVDDKAQANEDGNYPATLKLSY